MSGIIMCEATTCPISHPMVACSMSSADDAGMVVAVMLRPVYGREARNAVLGEVAAEVRRNYDGPVYVCADVDVYQRIARGGVVHPREMRGRAGCYYLPPAADRVGEDGE